MRNVLIAIAILALSLPAMANQAAQGFCTVGNTPALTQGLESTNTLQASFPQCQVAVYVHGTQTLATIFSDNVGTALNNPFTANTNGSWLFYAALGHYDVTLTGGLNGGFPLPFTISDILLQDVSEISSPFPQGVPYTPTPGGDPQTATGPQIAAPFTGCTTVDTILNTDGSCHPTLGLMNSYMNDVKTVGSPTTTDLGAEIQAAFSQCAFNCEVDVRPGPSGGYPWATTVNINTNTQLLKGIGPKGSIVGDYSGATDAILYQTNPFAALTNWNSGGVENITIMGSPSGRSGIHTGNVIGGHLYNVTVEGFTGSTGKCIWLDNVKDSGGHAGWYERNLWLNVSVGANTGLLSQSCTYDVYADNNNATNSFGYNRILDLQMNVNPGQHGIYLDGSLGQVYWYNGSLNATCNVNSGASQTASIPECLTITNNGNMKFNTVKLDGENNCLSGQSCGSTTGYGIHVLSGGQFLNAGAATYPVWQLGNVNDNYLQVDSLAFTSDFPYNTLMATDGDIVIATGASITGSYWVYANGTNRIHGMKIDVGANRFDTGRYNISVPVQYAFNGQAVITNPRVVYDANSAPQLVVTIGNRNSASVQMFAQYSGTSDHIPMILNGATVGTTPATTVYSYMVDRFGNAVNAQNYQAARVAVTDCYQLASAGPCAVKSATVPITADGTYIIADTTSNLTGRYVISWSSPNRNHFITADVGATRFDTNYTLTKAVDYAYVGQQVFTALAVLSDTNSDPQLQVTIGNRNDGSNPHNLVVTWYGDAANVPNLLPADALGVTARINRQSPGALLGVTASIGGGALAAGACATGGTVAPMLGADTTMAVEASPVSDPGGNYIVRANVTSANTVTVRVCAILAGTPAATTYNVRVIE